jgi:hypothetical protein
MKIGKYNYGILPGVWAGFCIDVLTDLARADDFVLPTRNDRYEITSVIRDRELSQGLEGLLERYARPGVTEIAEQMQQPYQPPSFDTVIGLFDNQGGIRVTLRSVDFATVVQFNYDSKSAGVRFSLRIVRKSFDASGIWM